MTTLGFALDGAWRVLAVGLALGAGLPLVFALGIRSLAWGAGGDAERDVVEHPGSPLGRPLAGLCFAVVVLAVALGITVIVASGFGQVVSFEHFYPTLADKA